MKLAAYIIILFSFVLLQSCATPDLGGDAEKKAIAKKTLKEVPGWFDNPPKSKKILYATGTAVSADMESSRMKATILAKRNLADKLDSYISSKTKIFLKAAVYTPLCSAKEIIMPSASFKISLNLNAFFGIPFSLS